MLGKYRLDRSEIDDMAVKFCERYERAGDLGELKDFFSEWVDIFPSKVDTKSVEFALFEAYVEEESQRYPDHDAECDRQYDAWRDEQTQERF